MKTLVIVLYKINNFFINLSFKSKKFLQGKNKIMDIHGYLKVRRIISDSIRLLFNGVWIGYEVAKLSVYPYCIFT